MAQSYFTMQDTHPGVESMLMDDAHYSLQMLGSPRVGIRRLLKRLRGAISAATADSDAGRARVVRSWNTLATEAGDEIPLSDVPRLPARLHAPQSNTGRRGVCVWGGQTVHHLR